MFGLLSAIRRIIAGCEIYFLNLDKLPYQQTVLQEGPAGVRKLPGRFHQMGKVRMMGWFQRGVPLFVYTLFLLT